MHTSAYWRDGTALPHHFTTPASRPERGEAARPGTGPPRERGPSRGRTVCPPYPGQPMALFRGGPSVSLPAIWRSFTTAPNCSASK